MVAGREASVFESAASVRVRPCPMIGLSVLGLCAVRWPWSTMSRGCVAVAGGHDVAERAASPGARSCGALGAGWPHADARHATKLAGEGHGGRPSWFVPGGHIYSLEFLASFFFNFWGFMTLMFTHSA